MADIGLEAEIGHGITITYDENTYNVLSVSGPDQQADSVETTHSTSANRWRTFKPGLKDGGEITCEVNLKLGEQPSVGDANKTLTVNFPAFEGESAGGSISTDAHVTGFSPEEPIDDRMTATITWKCSGEPTINAGTPEA
ncbi:hypothetical protein Pan216_30380 [Planctomycetes bacterium Pan216]|uniref:Lambda phage tail tube protein N-terminal domain-containing protein n=1 Tax=Kolteria novifilia TaxID=2527975 RepID=A0A518B5C1_9BACT|nr:hypothetical protein Pan216_30380 [Planctomycetes bacterium Pan216]